MLPNPEAVSDLNVGTVHFGEHLTVTPLENDLPEFEADLDLFTIESITPGPIIAGNPTPWIITISPDGQSLDIYYAGSPSYATVTLDYTMSDPIGATSTATVTFSAVGNG